MDARAAHPQGSPEITPEGVRALFREVLRGGDRVPGLARCREVATWLTLLRLRRTRPLGARPSGSRAAARAAAILVRELPKLEAAYGRFPRNVARVPALPFLEGALRDMAAVAQDLASAREALARLGAVLAPPHGAGPPWHAEAEGLYRVFCAAMAEANPGRRFEPSNDGPAVRFIRAALILAVDEERALGTIAQHLKRRRRTGTGPVRVKFQDRA